MRRISTRLLYPGMRLARRVYGKSGEVYLNAGVVLTRRYIERLVQLGFSAVYIEDRLTSGIEVTDVISEETRAHAVRQVKGLLTEATSSKSQSIICPPSLAPVIEDIVDQLLNNRFSVVNLTDIRAEGEYLFHHSVNVCVLAVMTGITLGYGRSRLFDLGMGALLHDVGKVHISSQILNKPDVLTREEFEEVKKHTTYGRNILRDHPEAAEIAYAHHERYNGDGYPRGLKGSDIDVFAQITGIADVFDALTSDRCYRSAQRPCNALELLSGAGDWWFEARLVQAFMENVAAYPTGTVVELNCGLIGVTVDTPKGSSFFPNVRVLLNAEGKPVAPYEISTVQENLWVSRVLEEIEVASLSERLDTLNELLNF